MSDMTTPPEMIIEGLLERIKSYESHITSLQECIDIDKGLYSELVERRREITHLRKYAIHKKGCPKRNPPFASSPKCECGLGDKYKENFDK